MTVEVFVSYRRGDRSSLELVDAIETVYDPERVFVDRSDIEPGAAFPAVVVDGVRSCAVVVALIGPGWVRPVDGRTDWVVEELNYAQQYQKPVLPVLLGVPMPDYTTLHPKVQYVAFRSALPRLATNPDELVQEIVQELSKYGVETRPRNTLPGTSRYAALASWTVARRAPEAELARVVERCIAGAATIKTRSQDYAHIRFGSKAKSRIWGMPLAKPEALPVDFQVRVRAGPGGTLVEARCDEAFGQGVLSKRKYDEAFRRVWALVAPT